MAMTRRSAPSGARPARLGAGSRRGPPSAALLDGKPSTTRAARTTGARRRHPARERWHSLGGKPQPAHHRLGGGPTTGTCALTSYSNIYGGGNRSTFVSGAGLSGSAPGTYTLDSIPGPHGGRIAYERVVLTCTDDDGVVTPVGVTVGASL